MSTTELTKDPRRDPVTGEYRVIAPGQTFKTVTDKISKIVLTPHTPLGWFAYFVIAGGGAITLLTAVTWLFLIGVGIWGITMPVAWGFAIINFVWWIGIGHAGTLISAILLLFKQQWRNSISRFAEAMTIFAVMCAALFPLIHVGRPWLGYWMLPLPFTMTVWPQFRSPLEWDVFAVSTYATISIVFWYVGMIPDFGTFRDRAQSKVAQYFYGLLCWGWRGSVRHWVRYESASLLLSGLATPLVLSVHTVISFDFAVAILPGWHTTIFPPYFVAGAIYSGFAMVLTLAIPLRKYYHLEALVTDRHIDNMGKVMLATGFIVAYGYGMEAFMSWYSANHWEAFTFWNRAFGPMGWSYWCLIACNLVIPLTTLWSRRLRNNMTFMFILSLIVNTGMWLERFVIIVTSLYRDYLPSSWGTYRATKWDYMTFVGTLGFFLFMFLLFVRFLPMIPMSEVKLLVPGAKITPKKPVEAGD
ncbi:MAG TPA: NrfD/PsrC family molybdoenzyme membrane anchor subunit [Terracidiphilus sp.]|nr:NrfD/PsrC family molybdoenzyme membrane anchor subunit [Terracidiphilus sp.]